MLLESCTGNAFQTHTPKMCASLPQDKCDARWVKNFESPVADVINLLDPNIDQSGWDDDKRQQVAAVLLDHAAEDDRLGVQAQLGAFILRQGQAFSAVAPTHTSLKRPV